MEIETERRRKEEKKDLLWQYLPFGIIKLRAAFTADLPNITAALAELN